MKKNKNIVFLIIILSVISFTSFAQRWKKVRYEIVYGVGVANYLGDLGGGTGNGRPFLLDVNMTKTRPSFDVGMRYRWTERVATKLNLIYGWVAGSDDVNQNRRTSRDLKFRSQIVELSIQGEYSLQKEKTGRRYSFGSSGKIRLDGINTYLLGGIGAFFFNPEGQYKDSKWYSLQPLGTEGQDMPGSGKSKYSRVQGCALFGIGFKYNLNRKINFGIEYGYRFTTTDYLDDASGSYYDNDKIRETRGEVAAYFADPRDKKAAPGALYRGNPKSRDGYMFILFNLSMKLRVSRSGLPKF